MKISGCSVRSYQTSSPMVDMRRPKKTYDSKLPKFCRQLYLEYRPIILASCLNLLQPCCVCITEYLFWKSTKRTHLTIYQSCFVLECLPVYTSQLCPYRIFVNRVWDDDRINRCTCIWDGYNVLISSTSKVFPFPFKVIFCTIVILCLFSTSFNMEI